MIQPLNDRVLVEVIEDSVVNTGAFEVAGEKDRKDRPLKGRIIAVSWKDPTCSRVKTGDTILFPAYGYDEIVEDGKTLALVPNDMILGIWTN